MTIRAKPITMEATKNRAKGSTPVILSWKKNPQLKTTLMQSNSSNRLCAFLFSLLAEHLGEIDAFYAVTCVMKNHATFQCESQLFGCNLRN